MSSITASASGAGTSRGFAPRACTVEYDAPTDIKSLRAALLRGEGQSEFSNLLIPAPPRDQTAFLARANGKQLVIAAALFDAIPHRILYQKPEPAADTLEIYFDLRHDRLAFFRFGLLPDGSTESSSFLPYPEAYSSAFPLLSLRRSQTQTEHFPSTSRQGWRCRFYFAWFDLEDVFAHGDQVGFNICRHRPETTEFSAWNFPSGNGGPDATGFGTLHLKQTPTVTAPAAPAPPAAGFTVALTYDFPDNLMGQPYTPESLRAEMALFKSWGIQRLHWIDYSDAPAFWKMPYWAKNYRRTRLACGDFLPCAVRQAHGNGLEIFADFKVFDLGYNTFFAEGPSTVPDLEGRRSVAIPEIAAHPECTMQSNPAWRRETSYPITRLRFFSKTPLAKIDPASVRLLVSPDNRDYQHYNQPFKTRQRKLRRPHARWTPAGKVPEPGAATNWCLDLEGLNLTQPFASLEIEGTALACLHQGFMLAEATGSSGDLAPLTLATTGHRDFRDAGYFFGKEWPGWNNYTEPLLQERQWPLDGLGFTFQEAKNLPTLLEPACPGAREIWLGRVRRILNAGVDGICIRIYNHHNGIVSWLRYAFAPAAVEAFREAHGREPEPCAEDYERIRRLRGAAFTQFLREAKALCAAAGKKLSVQLESGIEIPPHLDSRMQLHLDYETWFSEGIIDEALLKDWTAHSPWIHERIMPLARRHGVPIHVISRTLNNGLDLGEPEITSRLLGDAYEAGFSGFNFYEAGNLIELTPEGHPLPKGMAAPAISTACQRLRARQTS